MRFFTLLLAFFLSAQSIAFAHSEHDAELALSLERTKIQYQRIHQLYDDLFDLELDLSDEEGDVIIDDIIDQVKTNLYAQNQLKKPTVWAHLKKILDEIKLEAKVLSRQHGLALSIVIMTIEITELPMKAIAVSLGSPVVIVLYEVLQPGLLVPAMIVGVKKLSKSIKTKKYFGDPKLYHEWKSIVKSNRKQTKIKSGKNYIGASLNGKTYILKSSNFFNDLLKSVGLFKRRFDYKNIKRLIVKNNYQNDQINKIFKSKLPKQFRAKLLLEELEKSGHLKKIETRFENSQTNLTKHKLDHSILFWSKSLLSSKSQYETINLFYNLPKSLSPLLFMELWESSLKNEFFHYNNHFKRKFYRGLERDLLEVMIKLRKQALLERKMPEWSPENTELVENYFLHYIKTVENL
jgi:hypothetical protein